MDIGMILFALFMMLLCLSFIGLMYARNRINKRRYAELLVGDKFFLLDTRNGNKCIIEVKYIHPYKENPHVIVTSKGNEYKYGMNEFFERVLMKNDRYYYEKLTPDTFNNIKQWN